MSLDTPSWSTKMKKRPAVLTCSWTCGNCARLTPPGRASGQAPSKAPCFQSFLGATGSKPKSGTPSSSQSSDRTTSVNCDSCPGANMHGIRTYGVSEASRVTSVIMRLVKRGSEGTSKSASEESWRRRRRASAPGLPARIWMQMACSATPLAAVAGGSVRLIASLVVFRMRSSHWGLVRHVKKLGQQPPAVASLHEERTVIRVHWSSARRHT
mmetsp:Transcript_46227/g.114640  ORF Transcript_46227/g.114640 Transcript_46227/m.114640 type:complete len:212 (-) Transcript_46227:1554-2189(-)